MEEVKKMTEIAFLAQGKKLYGDDVRDWRFKCIKCGTVQTAHDFVAAKVPLEKIKDYLGFSCIGRFTREKGCDWTLGGFLTIHKKIYIDGHKIEHPIFLFADENF